MTPSGLFIGLSTLDCINLVDRFPGSNEKLASQTQLLTAGGPATNAAIAFAHFGHPTQLWSGIGRHPAGEIIRQELIEYGVNSVDLWPEFDQAPVIASVIVTATNGDRSVIYHKHSPAAIADLTVAPQVFNNVGVILTDGHQIPVSIAIAKQAKLLGIPVVLDGGSWKPGLDDLLPWIDYAICSANFYPPSCSTRPDLWAFLQACNIPYRAISQGAAPILYEWDSPTGIQRGEIVVETVDCVDSLGAGDILHGAFCHYLLHSSFPDALRQASRVASWACQSFGPREWMSHGTAQSNIALNQ